jgi:pleckstrin homology domain-containing family A member 1/2
LRPAHLAFYKTSAEYQLLRLLELSEVHSCTPVALKKHSNTFGLVSPTRTFYLQADTADEVNEWLSAIEDARQTLMATSTQNTLNSPTPVPASRSRSREQLAAPASPLRNYHAVTTSESEDDPPNVNHTSSPSREPSVQPPHSTGKEGPPKVILSGYLMKCGSKRRNWRKRWFVLNEEKLFYSGSHMVKRLINVLM